MFSTGFFVCRSDPHSLRLLYSEAAVVIGSLHVFFPMMALPLARRWAKSILARGRREDARRHGMALVSPLHCR